MDNKTDREMIRKALAAVYKPPLEKGRQAVLRGRTVKLSDRKMLINAANQAMVALQETHFAMISAGLLDQERLNKNFTAHEELRAALARFGVKNDTHR